MLQKDCDALVAKYQDSAFIWYRSGTNNMNELPPAIAALNPSSVIFYSPIVMRDFKDEPQFPVVRIKIFGAHSTGGHSIPYFGLEVICSTNVVSYQELSSHRGVSGKRYDGYRQVTDSIYERF